MDPLAPLTGPASDAPTTEDLRRELGSMKLTVQITLVSLVILTGALGVYMFRQVSLLRRQVQTNQRVAEGLYQNYNLNVATQAQEIERQLLAFAGTNAEFQARFRKFYPSNASPAAPLTAPSPAPAKQP